MAFLYKASKKGAFSGKISLRSAQGATTTTRNNALIFEGVMANGLKHAAKVLLLPSGGKVWAEGSVLHFEGCNQLTLLVDARTNYKPDYTSNWRGSDPLPRIEQSIDAAARK